MPYYKEKAYFDFNYLPMQAPAKLKAVLYGAYCSFIMGFYNNGCKIFEELKCFVELRCRFA
ncbi:MAG: hypothetical protein PUB42_00675 [Firmicutes bacterium]|nr:hypothetical protein [Bacillota bacterium]